MSTSDGTEAGRAGGDGGAGVDDGQAQVGPITEDERPRAGAVATLGAPKPVEQTRRQLAFGFLGLIYLMAVAFVALASLHWNDDTLSLLLDRVFVPLLALSGPAFGFYFASADRGRENRDR